MGSKSRENHRRSSHDDDHRTKKEIENPSGRKIRNVVKNVGTEFQRMRLKIRCGIRLDVKGEDGSGLAEKAPKKIEDIMMKK